jgi:hypothetical protein
LVVVAGLVAGMAGCGGDEGEVVRRVTVCVPVTDDRPDGTQGKVEIRAAATVLASGSIAAGGSFETTVPAGKAADIYLDGVLVGDSPAGTGETIVACSLD